MSKDIKNEMVPMLRFPEFKDADKWIETPLKELGKLVSGLTYNPKDVRDKGLLVLRSSNIQNGEIVLNDCVYVDPEIKGVNFSKPNDILICVRNGSIALIGKNALIPKGLPICTHGAFMTVFRSTNAKFVYQLFQSHAYYKQVSNDLGATINSINGGNFLKYKFYVPKTKEQQKIADCLSSLDELITAECQKLEAFKAHKKGLMQQLFPAEGETVPKLRFAEFRNSGDWELKTLGSICSNIISGKDKSDSTGKYDLYGSTGVIGKTNDCSYDGNFILVARVGTNAGLLTRASGKFGVTDNTLVLFLKHSESLEFVYYKLEQIGLNKFAFGSGQPLITGGQLKNLLINFPKLKEQQKIADCFFSLDELIAEQIEKIEALKNHKKGLMQHLFPN